MTENEYINAVKRNSQRLYLIAFSYTQNQYDAEDMMQNTFMKLWKSGKEFETKEHMDYWLTKVCVNECKDFFKISFRKSVSLENANDLASYDAHFNLDLFNAVSSLKKKERLAVHLFYYEELSIAQIAEIMKTTEGTVKSLLHRARKSLKAKLGDEWINE